MSNASFHLKSKDTDFLGGEGNIIIQAYLTVLHYILLSFIDTVFSFFFLFFFFFYKLKVCSNPVLSNDG